MLVPLASPLPVCPFHSMPLRRFWNTTGWGESVFIHLAAVLKFSYLQTRDHGAVK